MAETHLYHDNFQNFKKYNIKRAQLVIADIPYNLGDNAYASNPMWYEGGIIITARVSLLKAISLMAMGSLRLRNTFIFAINC